MWGSRLGLSLHLGPGVHKFNFVFWVLSIKQMTDDEVRPVSMSHPGNRPQLADDKAHRLDNRMCTSVLEVSDAVQYGLLEYESQSTSYITAPMEFKEQYSMSQIPH